MARVISDEYGLTIIDAQGYARRGPEFSPRYTQLEAMSGGQSGWSRHGTGFVSVYPVNSWAHRKITEHLAELESQRAGKSAPSRAAITDASAPIYGEWNSNDWIEWHKRMAETHGEAKADERWRNAWLEGVARTFAKQNRIKGKIQAFDAQAVEAPYSDAFKSYVAQRPTLHSAVYLGMTTASTTAAQRAIQPQSADQFIVGAEPTPEAVAPSSSRMNIGKLAGVGALVGALYLWWKSRADRARERAHFDRGWEE